MASDDLSKSIEKAHDTVSTKFSHLFMSDQESFENDYADNMPQLSALRKQALKETFRVEQEFLDASEKLTNIQEVRQQIALSEEEKTRSEQMKRDIEKRRQIHQFLKEKGISKEEAIKLKGKVLSTRK